CRWRARGIYVECSCEHWVQCSEAHAVARAKAQESVHGEWHAGRTRRPLADLAVACSDRNIAAIAAALPMEGSNQSTVVEIPDLHDQRRPVSLRAITRRWISLVP